MVSSDKSVDFVFSPFCVIAHTAVFLCKITLLELRTGTSPWFSVVLLRLTINTARINQQY